MAEAVPTGVECFVLPRAGEADFDPGAVVDRAADGLQDPGAGEDIAEVVDELWGVPGSAPLVAALTSVVEDALVICVGVFGTQSADEVVEESVKRGGWPGAAKVALVPGVGFRFEGRLQRRLVDATEADVLAGEGPSLIPLVHHLRLGETHHSTLRHEPARDVREKDRSERSSPSGHRFNSWRPFRVEPPYLSIDFLRP